MSSLTLEVGIVGLPNVGKSTLFNALLKKQQALAANYPFATIEPNIGVVPVPDERLKKLAEIVVLESAGPAVRSFQYAPASLVNTANADARVGNPSLASPSFPPIKPATVEFVDIAGLVKGASTGAGLGNKFLSHIREVKVIAHVVRAFSDPNVVRYEDSINPHPLMIEHSDSEQAKSDYQTINTELILADMQTVEKVSDKILKVEPHKKSAIEKLKSAFNQDKMARDVQLTEEEKASIQDLFLLSSKPELAVLNVSEEEYTNGNIPKVIEKYTSILGLASEKMVVICAKIESELSELSVDEQKEYLANLGLEESGLERLIKTAYHTLGLISFLTAGEKEVRAWTIENGTTAQNAAGTIHTDFAKAFIKAEIVPFFTFVEVGGWKKSRELGKARFEGKEYVVRDGDVIEFKVNA